jgi:ubiquinone/menaquinone biosynthesis C-methylase UbiE
MMNRIQREKDYHNRRFAEPAIRATKLKRFYIINSSVQESYKKFIFKHGLNKRVLEYGCGRGTYAFDLAKKRARVVGIDISDIALHEALAKSEQEKKNPKTSFLLMNAERLGFLENCFDLVCGIGILHHLQMDKAMGEINRVMHPEGNAIFIEPLGHNVFINVFRRFTPKIRSKDEHPLLSVDFKIMKRYFRKVQVQYFYLTALVAIPFAGLPGFNRLLCIFEYIDRVLFRFRFLRKQAWHVLIKLSEPIMNSRIS